jgi:DNA-binding transcriptional MocR family regulator
MKQQLIRDLESRWANRSPLEIANTISAPLFGTPGEWDLPKDVTPADNPLYLAVGIPDGESLPKQELRASALRVLDKPGDVALRYGFGRGPERIREWIAERRSRLEGFPVTADWFQMTNGSAGAIDLIVRSLINPGDIIISESPTYMGTLHNFRGVQADIRYVPMDEDGMDVDALAEVLANVKHEGKRTRLIYTISAYHNPTGATLSLVRRERMLELAYEYDAVILDDEAYRDLSYDEPPPRAISALAECWGVITTGTFSKTVATGIRVGWIHAHPSLLDLFGRMRFAMGQNQLGLRIFEDFLLHDGFDPHLNKVRNVYRRKRDILHGALTQEVSEFMDWHLPEGGFYFWPTLKEGIDATSLWRTGVEEGVIINNGAGFAADGSGAMNHIRIAYPWTPEDQFAEAARRLRRSCERVAAGNSA